MSRSACVRRHGSRTLADQAAKNLKVTLRGQRQEKTEILTGRQRQTQSRKAFQSEESFVFPIIPQRCEEEDGGGLEERERTEDKMDLKTKRRKSRKAKRWKKKKKLKKNRTNTLKTNKAPEYQRKGREPQTKQKVTETSET